MSLLILIALIILIILIILDNFVYVFYILDYLFSNWLLTSFSQVGLYKNFLIIISY